MELRPKILIVDDDVVARMMLMHMVDSSGDFDIAEAEDGEEAWRLLQAGSLPALCFCDLRMPYLSGTELLTRVRADNRTTELPFVLISAAADGNTMQRAAGLGADGYIVKPFQPNQVEMHLAALQARTSPVDEAPRDTLLRLGIDSARLLLYLGGLERQLRAGGQGLERLLEGPDQVEVKLRLARLREGCTTLGLVTGAATLQLLESPARRLDATSVNNVLDEVLCDVLHQYERARWLPGAIG
ncbi:MAG: response regulator [Pseudomonadota bacterium]|nr:response regulator [Pseudomonadota bacterium]